MRKASFAPVCDARTRVLILGSLPGDASLQQAQYYAHPQNQFWRLLAAVTGADLPAMAYAARLDCLLQHGIGLWDVIADAERDGSLDSEIRDHTHNDVPALLHTLPALAAIAFNGGVAARIGKRQLAAVSCPLLTLPSSSPAHTMALANKLPAWLALQAWLVPRA